MSVKALGENYFAANGYPVTVRQVCDDEEVHHAYDLTDKRHYHDFAELVIITGGHGVQWIDGVEYPVSAGNVFLLQGEKEHYFCQHDHLTLYNVMYREEDLALPMDELKRIPGYYALFVLEPQMRDRHRLEGRLALGRVALSHCEAIVQRMLREWEEQPPGWEVMLLSCFLELVSFLSREYDNVRTSAGRGLLRVGNVIGAMESDFRRQWRLGELAKLAHMSESHFLQVFREATGRAPIDYLLRLRVQKAMELLRSTREAIGDIAMRTGFPDSNYFSRQFRRITQMSPREYRKRMA